ncbi:MAG: hypothetical protein ACE5JS_13390 [Nitrospinota bacterium]
MKILAEKIIRLYRTNGVWIADHVNDDRMRADLGTTKVPWPFTSEAKAVEVLADVVDRQPTASVFLDFRRV